MNRYYGVLFEPVKQHGGLVQDVVGDSMLAIWATTEPDASLRNRAMVAALAAATAVDRFNAASGRFALPTRIGLHSGRLLLGSVGAIDHYEYRAVGDIVNTATRLEGLNKHLGTRLLVSAEVLHGLEDLINSRAWVVSPGRQVEADRGPRAGWARPPRLPHPTGSVVLSLPGLSTPSGVELGPRRSAALGVIAPIVRRRGWAKPLFGPPVVRSARRQVTPRQLGLGSCAWTRSSQRAA